MRGAARISRPTEIAFTEARRSDWEELEALVIKATRRGLSRFDARDTARLSPLYRNVCADLARARSSRYSAVLVDYLDGLVGQAHTVLYGQEGRLLDGLLRRREDNDPLHLAFPRAVRRRWRAMLLSFALFFVPMFIGMGLTIADPHLAFRVAPESMLRPLAEAYTHGFDGGRDASEGVLMAGFYVNNNVGIALRCFALGVFGGLGSAIVLVQNGLTIGAILGYVIAQGAGDNILTFILGHGSFELGAIVIAGGAGMSMGWAIVAPGDKTRLASLQAVAKDLFVVVVGAALMLLVAAGIEAFWSPSAVPSGIKRAVGGGFFVLVVLYVLVAGRGERAR
ncbi:MAG: stage II sporulation protein M [Myxococcales bacterium]|nr:stage II sporulation protein M [Myxococcales bacterium]